MHRFDPIFSIYVFIGSFFFFVCCVYQTMGADTIFAICRYHQANIRTNCNCDVKWFIILLNRIYERKKIISYKCITLPAIISAAITTRVMNIRIHILMYVCECSYAYTYILTSYSYTDLYGKCKFSGLISIISP